jgi:hypothetical protein
MNITLVEGRALAVGERVEVYYNLNKGGYSIKSIDKRNPNKGKVVAYADYVTLENATFHASEATLKRILASKQKSVYAVVRGYLVSADKQETTQYKRGYINPYTTGHFINEDTKEQLTTAAQVYFENKRFYFKDEEA